MSTNLSKIHSFLLNSYISTINDFVGDKILYEVDEKTARHTDNETIKFLEKLSSKISETKTCSRNCPLRKAMRS